VDFFDSFSICVDLHAHDRPAVYTATGGGACVICVERCRVSLTALESDLQVGLCGVLQLLEQFHTLRRKGVIILQV